MPPADTCADSSPEDSTRTSFLTRLTQSPKLVRSLVLSALGLGLLGLSSSGGGAAAVPAVPVIAASYTAEIDVPVRRASRTRPVAPRAVAPRAVAARVAARVTPRVTPKKRVAVAKQHTAHRSSATWVRPSSTPVTSAYGPRWGRMHRGIDFGARTGAPIRSIGAGVVIGAGYLGSESGYGKITLIRHSNGIISAYAHQSRTAVSAGERVSAGEVIGYVGSTGHSTGPHLHFEIRTSLHGGQVNPLSWLRSHGVGI